MFFWSILYFSMANPCSIWFHLAPNCPNLYCLKKKNEKIVKNRQSKEIIKIKNKYTFWEALRLIFFSFHYAFSATQITASYFYSTGHGSTVYCSKERLTRSVISKVAACRSLGPGTARGAGLRDFQRRRILSSFFWEKFLRFRSKVEFELRRVFLKLINFNPFFEKLKL